MEPCQTCGGNILLSESTQSEQSASFYCGACPCVCQKESKVKIKRKRDNKQIKRNSVCVKKQRSSIAADYVARNKLYKAAAVSCPDCKRDAELDRMKVYERKAVSCPECNHGIAHFKEMQTGTADDPMTTVYTCMRCKHGWKDN